MRKLSLSLVLLCMVTLSVAQTTRKIEVESKVESTAEV